MKKWLNIVQIAILILIQSVICHSQILNSDDQLKLQVQSLIQLKERVSFFLDLNKMKIDKNLNCLNKYDPAVYKGIQVKDLNLECYNLITNILLKSLDKINSIRVYKALISQPIGFFKSQVYASPLNIPEETYIARKFKFDVYEKAISWNSEFKNKENYLNESELVQAKKMFADFYNHTCSLVKVNNNLKNKYSINSTSEFCDLVAKQDRSLFDIKQNGRILLNQFSNLLISRYENLFVTYYKKNFEKELSTMPILVLISSPENVKNEIRMAFAYAKKASEKADSELKNTILKLNLENRILSFRNNQMSYDESSKLLEDLNMFFGFDTIAKYFPLTSEIKNPDVYNQLFQSYQKNEQRIELAKHLGLGVVTLMCFFPGAGSGLNKIGLLAKTLALLRSVEFKALCGAAVLTPFDIYLFAKDFNESERLNNLFFSTADGESLFVEYSKLEEKNKNVFMSLIVNVTLDVAVTVTSLKTIYNLSSNAYTKIVEFLKDSPRINKDTAIEALF